MIQCHRRERGLRRSETTRVRRGGELKLEREEIVLEWSRRGIDRRRKILLLLLLLRYELALRGELGCEDGWARRE